jgi:hypothetical protein
LGRPGIEVRIQWSVAIIAVVILMIASQISFLVTAWSMVLIAMLRFFLMTVQLKKVLELTWVKLIKVALPGVLFAIVIGLAWILSTLWLPKIEAVFWSFTIRAFVGLSAGLVIAYLGRKTLFFEITNAIKEILSSSRML